MDLHLHRVHFLVQVKFVWPRLNIRSKTEFLYKTKDKTKRLLSLEILCKLGPRPNFLLQTNSDRLLQSKPVCVKLNISYCMELSSCRHQCSNVYAFDFCAHYKLF